MPPAGWGFKIENCARPLRLWQMQKVPGIGSEAVAAGNGVGATFDALPQLAAEAKCCCGSKGRKWAGDGGSRRGCGGYLCVSEHTFWPPKCGVKVVRQKWIYFPVIAIIYPTTL